MALRFLLDTNVLSEPLKQAPDPRVLEHLQQHQHALCTASIVWHELLYGAGRMPAGARRTRVERYIADVVLATLPMLPYDASAASWHAQQRVRLEQQGLTPPFVDGMIAAVAATNDLTLVTGNLADYRGFSGLSLVSWLSR